MEWNQVQEVERGGTVRGVPITATRRGRRERAERMDVGQVLLLALAAPATYLLLHVLRRLEDLLPDPDPPTGRGPARAVVAVAQAGGQGHHVVAARPAGLAAAPAPVPGMTWSVRVPVPATVPAAVAAGAPTVLGRRAGESTG